MNAHASDLQFAHSLGLKGFRPYYRMTFEGLGEVEFISYAWPENGRIYIKARTTPGDPTTVQRFWITKGTLKKD